MSSPARNLRSRKKIRTKPKKVFAARPYSCSLCSFTSNIRERMVLHVARAHVSGEPFACGRCGFRSASHDAYRRHLAAHARRGAGAAYECDECEFVASQPAPLESHARSHVRERPYGCDRCQFRAAQLDELVRHGARAHGCRAPAACHVCEPAQRAPHGRRLCHVHTCASFRLTTLHLCVLCRKDCIERWSYRRTTIHLTAGSRVFYNYVGGVLTCAVCRRTFKAKIGYYSHMHMHMRAQHARLLLHQSRDCS